MTQVIKVSGLLFVALATIVALTFAMSLSASAKASPEKGNSMRSEAQPVTVTSVEAEVSDPSASNFEEEFTYYVVRFEDVEFDKWMYREPARLGGGENHVAEFSTTWDAFWFGVTAPDSEGIQHKINHKGQATQYFMDTEGNVYSLTAQFNGKGELLHVNGVPLE